MSSDKIVLEGIVIAASGNGLFKIKPNMDKQPEINCSLSGKIRQNNIKIIEGDLVKIEISPYDLTKGRIIRRLKNT